MTDANQIATFGGTAFSYDANGSLTSDGVRSYAWNARDQLVSLTGPVSGSFAYDGFGRRRSKTVGGVTTQFLYDGLNPVQELTGGTPAANLLTGLGIDEYFMRTDVNTEQVIAAIHEWYKALPPDVAILEQHETRHERVIRITPRVAGGAWIEFRIAPYGKADICFGNAGCHEEVEVSPEVAVDVCEATRRATITEETRQWRGRRIAARAVMELRSGARLKSEERSVLSFLPIGRTQRAVFVPWDSPIALQREESPPKHPERSRPP